MMRWLICMGLGVPLACGAMEVVFTAGASSMEVHVPKEGLMAFAGHEHTIEVLELRGVLERGASGEPERFELEVPLEGLAVTDRELGAEDRSKVRETMLSEQVLDAEQHPAVRFESVGITVKEDGVWEVSGVLTVRGMTAELVVPVEVSERDDGLVRAKGAASLELADFGIEPVKALGGMIRTGKVVEVRFDLIGQPAPAEAISGQQE